MTKEKTKKGDASAHGDTTIFRILSPMPFNARVEPMWHNVDRIKRKLNLIQWVKERGRVRRIVELVNDGLRGQGLSPDGWDKGDGSCMCNLRLDRRGVLQDLQAYARDCFPDSNIAHLYVARDKNAFYLPIDFPMPIFVKDGKHDVPVGSAIRLRDEMEILKPALQSDEFLDSKKMVAYFHASQKEVAKLETKAQYDPQFWAKFGAVLLSKLLDASLDNKMPIIFA